MTSSRRLILQQLQEQIRRREHRTGDEDSPHLSLVSTGVAEFDRVLEGRSRGGLIEWLSANPGSGAGTLALLTARAVLQEGGALVVCDGRGEFYPSVAAEWGISLEQLVLLRPRSRADLLWACDQTLRCPAVSATLGDFETLNDREFRRLQLAAEEGGGLGVLLRPLQARAEPSWAEVRWSVEPRVAPQSVRGRWIEIQLLRCRGGIDGTALLLEIDDAAHTVRLVPSVAPAKTGTRRFRAG